MPSSVTLSFTLPYSPHSFLPFPFSSSNAHPRLVSLPPIHALPSLQKDASAATLNKHKELGSFDRQGGDGDHHDDDDDGEDEEHWVEELVNELDPSLYLNPEKQRQSRRRRRSPKSTNTTINADSMGPHAFAVVTQDVTDWVERARERALLALEARNPRAAITLKNKIEPKGDVRKVKRKKKAKRKQKVLVDDDSARPHDPLVDDESASSHALIASQAKEAIPLKDDLEVNGNINDVGTIKDRIFDSDKYLKTLQTNGKYGPSNELGTWQLDNYQGTLTFFPAATKGPNQVSERDRVFNRRLVDAKSAEEVLDIVGKAEERVRSLSLPSLLTPLNAATALHRIAKHMETCRTLKEERLAFARQRHMAELVAKLMEVLSGCSAQGLSNIAWALSKIGGSLLYFSEMDLIAKAAMAKVSEFNAQNVANTLGAFASMQHAMPSLFESLCDHVADIMESFHPQELAQVLWAHAELSQEADPLLDALDCVSLLLEKVDFSTTHFDVSSASPQDVKEINPFGNASVEHLANIAWSYAVLDQIQRPSFKYFWNILEQRLENSGGDSTCPISTWHLSQIHQVNMCLQYECSHRGLHMRALCKDQAAQAWEKQKSSIWSTSAYQKEVKWLLVGSGQNWVIEYNAADYSLDLALVEEKRAIELDGPSHFIRNTGSPLGHTMLKRRLLACSGWKVLSISYATWEELNGEEEQRAFLRERLNGTV